MPGPPGVTRGGRAWYVARMTSTSTKPQQPPAAMDADSIAFMAMQPPPPVNPPTPERAREGSRLATMACKGMQASTVVGIPNFDNSIQIA